MRTTHVVILATLLAAELSAQAAGSLEIADSLRAECVEALKVRNQDRAKSAAATSERIYRVLISVSTNDASPRVGLAQLLGECRMTLVGTFSKGRVFDEGRDLLLGVLTKDSTHWGARFALAQFYYNAPSFMGHRRDAIRQLETLLRQQGDATHFPELATPYVMLGDLLTRENRPQDAKHIWEKGKRLFPRDSRFQQRLDRPPYGVCPVSVSISLGSIQDGGRALSRFGLGVALATAFLPLGLTNLLAILVRMLDPELPTWMRSRAVFPFLLYGTANVLGFLVLHALLGRATLRGLGVRLEFTRRTWKVATLGFMLGVLVFAIVNLSLRWLHIPTVRGMPETLTPITAAALFVSVGLVVPYCEEVLFRSVWYAGLREHTNDLVATILATIAFALIHIPYFGVGGMIFIALWTLIPIRLYAMTGNMTASWLMHVFNNTYAYVVVPILGLQPPGG